MAIKKKITKADYDKLSDENKKLYKAGDFSDTYILDVDGDDDGDDPAALRRALLREREEKAKLKKENDKLKAGSSDDDDDDGDGEGDDDTPKNKKKDKDNGDAKKIDAAWKKKYDKDIAERDAKITRLTGFVNKTLLDKTAEAMAAEISTTPKLMAPAIRSRLGVDFDGDEPELVILGDDGKANPGKTLDGLKKEFVANKEYSSILIASKASGGGAPKGGAENKTGGGAPASGDKSTTTDLSKLTGKNLVDALKAKKEAEGAS